MFLQTDLEVRMKALQDIIVKSSADRTVAVKTAPPGKVKPKVSSHV